MVLPNSSTNWITDPSDYVELVWTPAPGFEIRIRKPNSLSAEAWIELRAHLAEWDKLVAERGIVTAPPPLAAAPAQPHATAPRGPSETKSDRPPRPGTHGEVVQIPHERAAAERYTGQWWVEKLIGVEVKTSGDNSYFDLTLDDGGKNKNNSRKVRHLFASMPGYPTTAKQHDWLAAQQGKEIAEEIWVQVAYTGDVYPPGTKGAGNLRGVIMFITRDRAKASDASRVKDYLQAQS